MNDTLEAPDTANQPMSSSGQHIVRPVLAMTLNQMRHVADIACACDWCIGSPIIAVFTDHVRVGCVACDCYAWGIDLTAALAAWNKSQGKGLGRTLGVWRGN